MKTLIKLADLRKAVKAIESEASVSGGRRDDDYKEQSFNVTVRNRLEEVRTLLTTMGLKELSAEIRGSQWDWTHVLTVVYDLT